MAYQLPMPWHPGDDAGAPPSPDEIREGLRIVDADLADQRLTGATG